MTEESVNYMPVLPDVIKSLCKTACFLMSYFTFETQYSVLLILQTNYDKINAKVSYVKQLQTTNFPGNHPSKKNIPIMQKRCILSMRR